MSQKTLNFNSKQILSKEELIAWDESLRELIGNVLRYSRTSTQVGGIIDGFNPDSSVYINDFFLPSLGSVPSGGFNTLKIGKGRGILNFESTTDEYVAGLLTNNTSLQKQLVTLFKWEEKDNINISGISGYVDTDVVFVGFVPKYNPLEDGLCNISTNNQVTITGGTFTNLRGQSTKNPTKVRFYTEAGAAAVNSAIYEVISIVSDTQIIISGNLTAESNVKLMNVGSFDLSAQGSLSDKCTYVTANGELTFTKVAADITSVGGFIICSLLFGPAGAFSITDLRSNYLFDIGNSFDVIYRSTSQEITGAKTFSDNSPIFNVPVVDKENAASFASPLMIGAVSNSRLSIVNNGGNVFKFKATAGNSQLSQVMMDSGLVPGTHIYLYLDPTGLDATIYCATTSLANRIILPSAIEGQVSGVIKKGSLIELWANNESDWIVVNYKMVKPYSTWEQVTVIFDFNSNVVSNVTNVIKYKVEEDFVFVNIVKIAASGLDFPLTFSIPYSGPEIYVTLPYSGGSQFLTFTVNTIGECTLTSTAAIGIVNVLIPLHN